MDSHTPALTSLLAAAMRHELRTPLDSILALSRLLLEPDAESLPEERLTQAAFIQASAQQLSALLEDLQLLASLDAGAEPPAPGPADPTRFPVVVLDREPHAAVLYECYLRSAGFQAVPAGGPEDAEREAAGGGAIAVLLDAGIGETASELGFRLRRCSPAPLVIGIAQEESPLPWADAVLSRPVSRKRLLELLRRRARQEQPGLVLVVSDHAPDRIALRTLLSGTKYQAAEAGGAADLLRLCEQRRPVAILWHAGSGDPGSGRLPAVPVSLDIPVIMVTTTAERDGSASIAGLVGDVLCIGGLSRQEAVLRIRQALGQADTAQRGRAEVSVGPQRQGLDPQCRERGR